MSGHLVHGGRSLLNGPGRHTTAAIVAEVENTADWKPGRNRDGEKLTRWRAEPDVVLQLANCDRSIAFSIEWESVGDRKAALEKVDTMIRVLKDFRKGLAIEQQRYEKRIFDLPEDE